MLRHGSLFSGIGGFDLAAEWMGWENVFHCEYDPFCQKVLKHHFPNSKLYNNVKTFDATAYAGRIDILTGGFPCQPFSSAGKRKGKEDERHLWPSMLRIIREVSPKYVVGENVRGLLDSGGLVFEEVCADLEAAGYEVTPYLLPAAGVGSCPHRRDRIWFVARRDAPDTFGLRLEHSEKTRNVQKSSSKTQSKGGELTEPFEANGFGRTTPDTDSFRLYEHRSSICSEKGKRREKTKRCNNRKQVGARHTDNKHFDNWENFPTQPPLCGGDDGLPRKLDSITFPKWRKESIKAYGNAIVPAVAHEIFKAIQKMEDLDNHGQEI